MIKYKIVIEYFKGEWVAEVLLGGTWRVIARRRSSVAVERAVKKWLSKRSHCSTAFIEWMSTPDHQVESGVQVGRG